ncbi:MAG: 50S ribosomal protein L10 [Pirellulales bacterium]|nr:50S ribosomal protein L10 [Pirellulales bacterium]
MSKFVKDLLARDLKNQLNGVSDALLVNVIGLDSIRTSKLRTELRKKNIKLEVVKNSMARRATEGTPLAPAFEGVEGTLAVVWGAYDFVSLTKEIVRLSEVKDFAGFTTRGGAMDGGQVSSDEVKEISKWPSRQEQLAMLVGQILGPGSKLASQLLDGGGALVSQVKTHLENLEKADRGEAPAEQPAAT